jgi:hypothetical protein
MRPQRWDGRGRWTARALVVVASTVACTGTNPAVTTLPEMPAVRRIEVRGPGECPGERDTLRDTGFVFSFLTNHVPFSNIPEFHDCQRFIVRDSTTQFVYDSLFAIFASFRLNQLAPGVDTSKDTATVTVGQPDTSFLAKTIPVATIFSDHRQYNALGIKPGFNCLFLYQVPFIPGRWGAMMFPLTSPDSECISAHPPRERTILKVYSSSVRGLTESDYPAVARWDWDSVHSEQYIDIKCGAAWCQVGRVGFDTSASYSGPPLPFTSTNADATRRIKRVTAVRGWYDEQFLALYQDGHLRPSRIRGILVPDPDIDGAPSARYDRRRARVGFAVLIGGDYGKWNYRRPVNEIVMCRGTAGECKVDLNQPAVGPSLMSPSSCPTSATNLWAIVTPSQGGFPPGGVAKALCIRVTDHHVEIAKMTSSQVLVSLPGTGRWRWLAKDEGSWFGCITSSCCTKT